MLDSARRTLRMIALSVASLIALGAGGEEPPAVDAAAASAEPHSGGAPADEGGFTFPPEVEALLNKAADPEAYTETERCIMTRDIRGTEILDNRHLVFRLSGKRYFLVQFAYTCPGLRRGVSLIYESRDGRLCRLDQIRAFEPGPAIPNPPCTLPGFMPVEKEQVALLKESLKSRRKAELDAYKAEKAEKADKENNEAQQQPETEAEPVSG